MSHQHLAQFLAGSLFSHIVHCHLQIWSTLQTGLPITINTGGHLKYHTTAHGAACTLHLNCTPPKENKPLVSVLLVVVWHRLFLPCQVFTCSFGLTHSSLMAQPRSSGPPLQRGALISLPSSWQTLHCIVQDLNRSLFFAWFLLPFLSDALTWKN